MHGKVLKVSRKTIFHGSIRPPSDKSLTHRALIFASLSPEGISKITNPLLGEDCLSTVNCLTELGAEVEVFDGSEFNTDPFALVMAPKSLQSPDIPLDCGNSGTTMRLLAGVLASRPGIEATLIGDNSLSRRPMKRIAGPLSQMGGQIHGETPPLTISGRLLTGISYMSPVASAQIKSCLLIAGLRATGETWVSEPNQSRDHTERMFEALGVEVLRDGDLAVGVKGGQDLAPLDFNVPADISSAAFLIVAAALIPGSQIVLTDLGVNQSRTGIFDVMRQSGVWFQESDDREELGEPVATLEVKGGNDLFPFQISGSLVPRLIDEIPVLAILATQCNGISSIRDAKELRVKESDRLELVAQGLKNMGAKVTLYEDGFDIEGPTNLKGCTIDADGDHRIAMAFAIAGLIATGETTILNAQSILTSYPNFESDIKQLSQS